MPSRQAAETQGSLPACLCKGSRRAVSGGWPGKSSSVIKGLETRTFEARPGWLVIYAFSSGPGLHPTPPHHPATLTCSPALGPTLDSGRLVGRARTSRTLTGALGCAGGVLHTASWIFLMGLWGESSYPCFRWRHWVEMTKWDKDPVLLILSHHSKNRSNKNDKGKKKGYWQNCRSL